jgi:microcystin-dependent protein
MTTIGTSYNVAPNPNDSAASILPIGSMLLWSASTAPSGFLLCDGSAVNRLSFAALFAVIGTTWGVGDGSTTFNVPNTAGRVVRGVGSGYAQATSGGLDTQTATGSQVISSANLPPHRHQQARGGGINIISSGSTQVQGISDNTGSDGQTQPNATYQENGTTLVANTALPLSVSGSVVNPYVAINYIIKSA